MTRQEQRQEFNTKLTELLKEYQVTLQPVMHINIVDLIKPETNEPKDLPKEVPAVEPEEAKPNPEKE